MPYGAFLLYYHVSSNAVRAVNGWLTSTSFDARREIRRKCRAANQEQRERGRERNENNARIKKCWPNERRCLKIAIDFRRSKRQWMRNSIAKKKEDRAENAEQIKLVFISAFHSSA